MVCLDIVICRYEALKASPSEIRAFEEEVSKTTTAPQQLGDIKTEDLPGKEILNERGKREGQTILVKDGASVSAYMWSMDQQTWNKIGKRIYGKWQDVNGKLCNKNYDNNFRHSLNGIFHVKMCIYVWHRRRRGRT